MAFYHKITGTHLGILVLFIYAVLVSCNVYAGDNKLTIVQSGSDLTFTVDQIGNNNEIKMKDGSSFFTGSDWTMALYQKNVTNKNTINIDELNGSSNTLRFGQGGSLTDNTDTSFTYDGVGYGGHTASFEILGSSNTVVGYQESDGNGSHTYDLHLAGNNNSVWTAQESDTNKSIDLTIYNSGNTASIEQTGSAAHSATITLDGSYGTNLSLLQQGTTAQSYTISQLCQTVSGCSISVTQQ